MTVEEAHSGAGGNVAYSYYKGSIEVNAAKRERSRRNAQIGAQFWLDPSNRDVDSLIFWHRRMILLGWLRELGQDLVVLDIGGRIQPYRALVEQNTRLYIGLDLQFEGMIDLIAGAEVLPLATDSIDLVLCTDTLQYVPDAPSAIREMHRVLKPGGQLILSTRGSYPEHHDELWRFPSGRGALSFPDVQVG